jgi:hypothetical protein
MQWHFTILPDRKDYPRLGAWLFGIAWIVGSIGLILGLNGGGRAEGIAGICTFALACFTWWGAFRLGGATNPTGGAVALLVAVIWAVNLALFAKDSLKDPFFWALVAAFLLLIATASISYISSAANLDAEPRQ